jgi:hypothetical protein
MVKPKYGISHYGLGLKYEPITNSSRPQEALGSAMSIFQASFIMVESPAVSLDYYFYFYFHSHLLEEQFPDSFTSYSYCPCQFIMYHIVMGTSYCRYYYYYYYNCSTIMYILNILVMLVTS